MIVVGSLALLVVACSIAFQLGRWTERDRHTCRVDSLTPGLLLAWSRERAEKNPALRILKGGRR